MLSPARSGLPGRVERWIHLRSKSGEGTHRERGIFRRLDGKLASCEEADIAKLPGVCDQLTETLKPTHAAESRGVQGQQKESILGMNGLQLKAPCGCDLGHGLDAKRLGKRQVDVLQPITEMQGGWELDDLPVPVSNR